MLATAATKLDHQLSVEGVNLLRRALFQLDAIVSAERRGRIAELEESFAWFSMIDGHIPSDGAMVVYQGGNWFERKDIIRAIQSRVAELKAKK